MRAFSLLTLLLPFVAANLHHQCACRTWTAGGSWIQNDDLTHYICYSTDNAHYDDKTHRCQTENGYMFSGQTWEDTCRRYGVDYGYFPFNGGSSPDLNQVPIKVGAAVGSCPDRG
ncbi:hypothetical protein E4U58_000891 [Claviceps cyperi]|nr:hypothetical protein E4U58_000891 [Claviceps cyperi]